MDRFGSMAFGGIRAFSNDMDFFFDNMFRLQRPVMMPSKGVWHPPMDVLETADYYIVILEIAGIRQDDVRLSIEGGQLTIRGLRREMDFGEKFHYHIMEIDFGPFERKIHLPENIDADNMNALYKDGFLEIRLGKRRMTGEKTVTIEVES